MVSVNAVCRYQGFIGVDANHKDICSIVEVSGQYPESSNDIKLVLAAFAQVSMEDAFGRKLY